MRKAKVIFSLLFVVLECSANSIPVAALGKFFMAGPTTTPSCGDFTVTTLGQNFNTGSGISQVTVDTTGMKALYVITENGQTGSGTLTDNQGNTYVPHTPQAFQRLDGTAAWQTNVAWTCLSPNTSASTTITLTGTNVAFVVYGITSSGTISIHTEKTATQTGGNTIQPGSITPNGTELFVVGAGWWANNSASIDSSFSTVDLAGGGFVGASWKESSSAENPTVSLTGSPNPATASMIAFVSSGCTGGGGGSAWAQVAHVGMSAISSGGTSSAINTTGANSIFVVEGSFAGCPIPTDSKGNTYFCVVSNVQANYYSSIWACTNPVVGSGHTFTSSANYGNLNIMAFSGGAGGVTDKTNSNIVAPGGATTIQPKSITPSVNNELVISSYNSASTASVSIDSSMTITDQQNSSAGSEHTAAAFIIQTSAGAINPTWSQISGVGDDTSACIASFK